MNKTLLVGFISALILTGAGCSNKNDLVFEEEALVVKQPPVVQVPAVNKVEPSAGVVPVSTQTEIGNKTPRARGVVRVKVVSAKTKMPVSGVIIVTEGMSGSETVKKTNLEGWVEFPQTWGNVYIPKNVGYKGSDVVNTMDGDKDGYITLLLEADVISGSIKQN